MEQMRVGLLGLGRGGRQLADALIASSWCKLVAVASVHSNRIEKFKEVHPDIAVHNDFRSLIVSTPLDALFVAVPPFMRGNYLPLAAERKIPTYMLLPASRRIDEALSWLEPFEAAKCPIVVSRAWGIEPALHPDALGLDQAGKFFLARISVTFCMEENFDWRGDSQRAGGGVLLYGAYDLIDMLIQAMGMPSTVYAACSAISRPGTRFQYDTEDTAAVVCRYANGALATVNASWTTGPAESSIDLYGTTGSVHVREDCAYLKDRTGERELVRQKRPASTLAAQVEEFLSTLRSNPRQLRGTLRQHLPVVATIQAAYLSARTGQPESPEMLIQMHNVKTKERRR
ncbi:MAG TPA: Gfo/Idh/MocA family oxidoreductase [Phycisphaerae bacterium]|nr:Gfo/Idh/MocA family oxidoreductase [Phycisphaerae bacterium]HOQ87255.1 Gfo/Idh/MocA family oxidoreductase [Phycisphaerae bacterium]HQE28320.1 Gfo/Idh/MocA family oxidoreductase [Phycisphaerae bacterium]